MNPLLFLRRVWAFVVRDWRLELSYRMTNAMPLLPGARNAPVGTPDGITETSMAKFGTNREGNSFAFIPALGLNLSPAPKLTK